MTPRLISTSTPDTRGCSVGVDRVGLVGARPGCFRRWSNLGDVDPGDTGQHEPSPRTEHKHALTGRDRNQETRFATRRHAHWRVRDPGGHQVKAHFDVARPVEGTNQVTNGNATTPSKGLRKTSRRSQRPPLPDARSAPSSRTISYAHASPPRSAEEQGGRPARLGSTGRCRRPQRDGCASAGSDGCVGRDELDQHGSGHWSGATCERRDCQRRWVAGGVAYGEDRVHARALDQHGLDDL